MKPQTPAPAAVCARACIGFLEGKYLGQDMRQALALTLALSFACLSPPSSAQQGLNLEAMAALDAHIDTLRDEFADAPAEAPAPATPLVDLPDPFICELRTLLTDLEDKQADTLPGTLARWQNLIDAHGVEALPVSSLPEKCAVYQSLTLLLDLAIAESAQCQPMESALRLATLVPEVPDRHQGEIARLLADLADQHEAARAAQGDPTSLCPLYREIEARIEALKETT